MPNLELAVVHSVVFTDHQNKQVIYRIIIVLRFASYYSLYYTET